MNIEDIINSSFEIESNDNIEVNSINAELNKDEEISQKNLHPIKINKRKNDYMKDDDENIKEDVKNEKINI